MTDRRKTSPFEGRKTTEDEARRELDRVSALEDHELDAELRAAGVDPDEADAIGRILLERAARDVGLDAASVRAGSSGGGPSRRLPRARRRVTWLVTALVIAAVVAAVLVGRGVVAL